MTNNPISRRTLIAGAASLPVAAGAISVPAIAAASGNPDAKLLASTFPKASGLSSVYFVNSGSEANDLAVLMSRAFTGNYDLIALRNGYHGGSAAPMALTAHSTWKFNVPHSFGVPIQPARTVPIASAVSGTVMEAGDS